MGIAAWRVWRGRDEDHQGVKIALTWWSVQLSLNAGWSLLFFGLRKPRWAWLEIFVLWGSIALTLREFWKRDPLAGALLVPYLTGTTFAALLTTSIYATTPTKPLRSN